MDGVNSNQQLSDVAEKVKVIKANKWLSPERQATGGEWLAEFMSNHKINTRV